MVLCRSFSIALYKLLGVDVWGLGILALQQTEPRRHKKSFKFFYGLAEQRKRSWGRRRRRYVYRLDEAVLGRRRRRHKKAFRTLRLVKAFYGTLAYVHFRRLARGARKKDGFFEGHYCLALEGRVVTVLYRTGFVATMFEAWAYVRRRWVTVQGRHLSFANAPVGLYRLLGIRRGVKKRAYYDWLLRLCVNRRSLFNGPSYMYLSYWFLFAFMAQAPMARDLVGPKFLDIYRATGYAH